MRVPADWSLDKIWARVLVIASDEIREDVL
mgnify:CR=1 FL=1